MRTVNHKKRNTKRLTRKQKGGEIIISVDNLVSDSAENFYEKFINLVNQYKSSRLKIVIPVNANYTIDQGTTVHNNKNPVSFNVIDIEQENSAINPSFYKYEIKLIIIDKKEKGIFKHPNDESISIYYFQLFLDKNNDKTKNFIRCYIQTKGFPNNYLNFTNLSQIQIITPEADRITQTLTLQNAKPLTNYRQLWETIKELKNNLLRKEKDHLVDGVKSKQKLVEINKELYNNNYNFNSLSETEQLTEIYDELNKIQKIVLPELKQPIQFNAKLNNNADIINSITEFILPRTKHSAITSLK